MSVGRKMGLLAMAAGVCLLGTMQQGAWAQAGAPGAQPGARQFPPQLTDTPVAPPNTEAMRLAGIAKDNSRGFGSSPDDGGPLDRDLSRAITPEAVGAAMRKVADSELAGSQQYFTVVDRARNMDGRIWTWSVLYAGYMAAADALNDARYRDAMEQVGKSYNWGLRSTQMPSGDDQSIAQMYLELYLKDRKPEQIAPIQTALDGILAAPRPEMGPQHRITWWWCDALFMGPPVWARMYAATGDRKYISYLDEEWAKTSQLLYDPQAHLYSRDASYITRTEKNGQKMFWSRGEGWVMGGLARTLEYLPKDDPARAKYETQLREMAAALAKIQGPDGLWRAGLLDPADYDQPEISGSSLITFGMAWGINNGILDRAVYGPVVTKAWVGMLQHIYTDGRLGDIQQTGAEPAAFKPAASYNYGIGGFLLAGSEMLKLAQAGPQTAPVAAPQAAPAAPTQRPQRNGAPVSPDAAARARKFGSVPDDPGPLAKDLSPKLKPKPVAAAMRKVADWQLAQSQQYFAAFDRSKQLDGAIWTWGALYSGLMAASQSLGDPKYANVMRETGKAYNWELSKTESGANQHSMAQTYLELYLMDKEPEELAPTKATFDDILTRPRVEVGSTRRIEWWWCDALFMAPPAWARLFAATGDKKYITYLDEEWAKTSQELWDPASHLYFRDTTFITAKEKNGEKVFWSRGEGWVMGGLARTLEYVPKDDPARAMYETQLKEMSAALAKIQGPDGLWRSGLLDPASYDQPEISGSALIAFGMAWGINNGILDRKTYKPVVEKAWAGMLQHIYADGRLGDIQQTGSAPALFKPSSSFNYGVGGFLLAGSEIYKMAGGKPGKN
ncbi:MAG: glycoside hydrolase family 88 protein [Acidobacteriaceae bacterium]